MVARGDTVAVAESCTGGLVASSLVAIPGSSAWFHESFVTYSNDAKVKRLNVRTDTLDRYGAVSDEVVCQMAQGVAWAADAACTMATSGIAGPDGGTAEKPVGTVWYAVSVDGKVTSDCTVFVGDRESVRNQATLAVLNLLLQQLER